MRTRKIYLYVAPVLVLFFLCGIVLLIPSVTQRVAYYLEQLQIKIRYTLKPPEQVIFVPNEQVATLVYATLYPTIYALSEQPVEPSLANTLEELPQATSTPTIPPPTATPLPDKIELDGVRYEDQHGLWNYCAPANLAMALSYWGWEGDRLDTGHYLKPLDDDKNVMMYEMENYVIDETSYGVIYRYGGTLNLIKAFLAEGYPVLLETGVYIRGVSTGKISWTGHYTLATGYDDNKAVFNTQDSYYQPDYLVSYVDMIEEWRSFNYVFMVIFPEDRRSDVTAILGDDYADIATSAHTALQTANEEIKVFGGIDLFFALFNRASSYVWMQDFISAANGFDEAYRLYPSLSEDRRPWRITWYQTTPYYAYYYTGRYQDVITLADQTLDIHDPFLEESYYWRARAKAALGDTEGALADVKESLRLHEGFTPSVQLLQDLGG